MHDTSSRPLLFIHIRKTAGVSLRGLLANRFPADRILFQAHAVNGPQEPGDAMFVTGHVDFDYTKRFRERPKIFTMLREPVSRALSAWHFYQSHTESYFGTLQAELSPADHERRRRFDERARELGMFRFLLEEEALARDALANVQTRQLAGAACAAMTDDDPRLMAAALDHLHRIDLTGLVERPEETLRLLGETLRWGKFGPLPHLNLTPRLPTANDDPRCIETLRAWNQLDLQLYVEASRLFEDKCNALSPGLPEAACQVEDRFTPDQPIHGFGWHEREYHEGRWLCWNAASTASLKLRLSKPRPTQFRCLVPYTFSEAAMLKLQIELNSVPLALQRRAVEDGILLESEIPPQTWATNPDLADITFRCPLMGSPRDLDPNSTDVRNLGFALAEIGFAAT